MTLNLKNNETYISSCVRIAKNKLKRYNTVKEIESDISDINKYENINLIEEPKDLFIIEGVSEEDIKKAKRCVLEGKFFAEHAAAGEATRLGLGTKYLINMAQDLTAEKIAELTSKEKGKEITKEDVIREAGCDPKDLLPISLGTRHMIQYSFDIFRLAEENNLNPDHVLAKQKILIILNEKTADKIIEEFRRYNFFGFNNENVFFMIQKSYHGISVKEGRFFYDEESPKRLHNHGQMVMQQTMDFEIFIVEGHGNKKFLKSELFGDMLKKMEDKQSFCIEDMMFLTQAIDFKPLAVALKKSEEGFRMIMEVVSNNPENPQKGGMAAFDPVLQRNVMIESFQLKGMENKDIKFLNKNFNHYPKPYESWLRIKEIGLNMPVAVKENRIYFQPVQGDINFLVKTEFVQHKDMKPIKHWKSPATASLMIKFMKMQDEEPGFREYAERFIGKLKR